MKKIAICIPTYNRAEVIEELLVRYHKDIADIGYDLYVCDSSENTDTQLITSKFTSINAHIMYKKMSSDMHSNRKVFELYKDNILNTEYEYIWICSDSIRFSVEAYKSIYDGLDFGYDFIMPDARDFKNIGTKVYDDCQIAFKDFGWDTALYGATIVRCGTVLCGVDWNEYEKKWLIPERLNYSHVGLIFERMSEMADVRIYHLHIHPSDFSVTPLRPYSGWRKEYFYFMCELWPNAIKALPKMYDKYKDGVIRDCFDENPDDPWDPIASKMKQLRKDRILNLGTIIKYWHEWNTVTSLPKWEILMINFFPWVIRDSMKDTCIKIMKKEVILFYKEHPDIYIYGCGQMGGWLSEYLDKWGIKYRGFFVTETVEEKSVFKGHRIFRYDKKMIDSKKTGIILGMNQKYSKDVLKRIRKDINDNQICICFFSKYGNPAYGDE